MDKTTYDTTPGPFQHVIPAQHISVIVRDGMTAAQGSPRSHPFFLIENSRDK